MFITRIYREVKRHRKQMKRLSKFGRPYKSRIKNFWIITLPLFIINLNFDEYEDYGDYDKAVPIFGIVCLLKESKDLNHWWKFIRFKLK